MTTENNPAPAPADGGAPVVELAPNEIAQPNDSSVSVDTTPKPEPGFTEPAPNAPMTEQQRAAISEAHALRAAARSQTGPELDATLAKIGELMAFTFNGGAEPKHWADGKLTERDFDTSPHTAEKSLADQLQAQMHPLSDADYKLNVEYGVNSGLDRQIAHVVADFTKGAGFDAATGKVLQERFARHSKLGWLDNPLTEQEHVELFQELCLQVGSQARAVEMLELAEDGLRAAGVDKWFEETFARSSIAYDPKVIQAIGFYGRIARAKGGNR